MFSFWVAFCLLGIDGRKRASFGLAQKQQHRDAHTSPSDFLSDRRILVKSSPWVRPGRGILPLQIVRGANPSVRTQLSKNKLLPEATLASLDHIFSLSDDVFISLARNTTTLSTSARALLNNWETLSLEDRHRVRNKIAAEKRASTPLDPLSDLHILHYDSDVCVVNKPSGVLSVPGPRRNPSVAQLVFDIVGTTNGTDIDQMVVHRLDMDTSGVLMFALNTRALSRLHDDFRGRRVKKTYQALLVGHLHHPEVEIEIDLERDPLHVPFMRAAQPKSEREEPHLHPSFRKMMKQAPKPSKTELRVLAWEYLKDTTFPVTRVELVPHTGRTHQLRVHCAALGFPIVGDDIYGYYKAAGDCGIPRDSSDIAMQVHRHIHQLQIPLCLHAKELSFFHPRTGAPVMFHCEPPF
mmetsp:Transcript_23241/g.64655  ORF Transcript_23241/g.64655 Transcript_23241/m.64655 type:complete len:409 (+) Transcript_23241:34-1260(+)